MSSPSSRFESDYLNIQVAVISANKRVQGLIELIQSFPEGSARRLEIESALFALISHYTLALARHVREKGLVTLYDDE